MAYSEGYDHTIVEVTIIEPKDRKIAVKPGMKWGQIKVMGKPMSLIIRLTE